MNKHWKPVVRATLAATLLGLGMASAVAAEPQLFLGKWKSDNPASTTPDAVLTFDGDTLSWRPRDKAPPQCSGTFALQPEKPGTVYVNGLGRKFVAGAIGSFPSYLLNVNPGTCGGTADQWRVSFPLAYDRRHMEVTEYKDGKAMAYRRLQRVD